MKKRTLHSERLGTFIEQLDIFPSLIPLNGKIPIEEDWTFFCENTRLFIAEDFKDRNAGICCGPSNGIIAIDVDDPAKFEAICKAKGWDLPSTRWHQTGTGKHHIIYKYPKNGKRYGNRSFKKYGFDIRGIGGQIVAPGSIHPETGQPYKVLWDLPIEPAPQWLLDLALQDPKQKAPQVAPSEVSSKLNIDTMTVSASIKAHIKNGVPKGQRSEIIASVLSAFVRAKISDEVIFQIFDRYPIGEKYRGKGHGKEKWLQGEIQRARGFSKGKIETPASGVTLGELKKEFGQGEKLEFLWNGVIPKYLPIMWAGREGHGKTTILLQAVKEILETHSESFVVWLSTEGTVFDTINKASVLGIESDRFRIARKKDGQFKFNLERYDDRQKVSQILTDLPGQTLVVIIDSVRGMSKHSENDDVLGRVMQAVNAVVCDQHKAGLVYIDHYKKGTTVDPLDKVAGTTAKTAAVRLVMGVVKTSATAVHIKATKSNFLNVEIPELESIQVGDKIHIRVLDNLSDESLKDKAQTWLTDLMAKNKEMYASDVYRMAEEKGFSDSVLKKAKKDLPIISTRINNRWKWIWDL